MSRARTAVAVSITALLIASGLAVILPTSATAASTFDAAKVLDLPFDDSLTDAGPGKVSASMLRGSAAYTAGINGRALSLRGADAVDLGKSPALQPQNLTLSFWFKPDGSMAEGEQVFSWNKTVYNSPGWYLTSEGANTPLALSIGPGGDQPYKVSVSGSREVFFPAGQWTHVVATYDRATKAVAFYRNGEKQASAIANAVGGASTGELTSDTTTTKSIGFNGANYNGAYVRGALDDYELYNAVAGPEEVVALTRANNPAFDPADVAARSLETLSVPAAATTNFSLTTSAGNGSTVSWTSSDTTAVTVSGDQAKVTRPADADATVTLTASATYAGSAARTKTFEVTIPKAGTSTSIYVDDTDLNEVQLLDPYLQNSNAKMVDYLLTLDPKRFLYSFDQLAGIPTTVEPYGGWERTTGARFQGHFFGHYMSALSQAYSTEADAGRKAQLLAKLTTAVDGVAAAQSAYAQRDPSNAGYVAPFPVSYLPHGADGLIVPFYNLHKVLAGLLDAHDYAPREVADKALATASGFGSWLNTWGSRQANPSSLLSTEYGGMNEALYELYGITENEQHKQAAQLFDEVSLFQDLAANRDVLAGKHANTTIPKLTGALKRYTVLTDNPTLYARLTQGEKDGLDMYRRAAENFWQMVVKDHSYVGGGNSYSEHFQQPGTLYEFATNGITTGYGEQSTVEGCNEYNMLKLTHALFRVTPDVKYADYYENTYINTILASQNPETGMMTYFQPQTAGYAKVFGRPEGEFWCDHGTATESFTKLGDSIYFRKGSSIYVNMFRSTVFSSATQNLTVTQTADIPNTDVATFDIASLDGKPLADGTTLRLRVPDWSPNPALTVNGQARDAAGATQNGYVVIPVTAGDKITYTVPAKVEVEAGSENPNWVAFRYGPVVLSTELNRTNVDASAPAGILVRTSVADKSVSNSVRVADVSAFTKDIEKNLVRRENGADNNGRTVMKFGLQNVDPASAALTFEPYYSMYNARYALYMNLIQPDSPEAQALIKADKERLRIDEMTTDALTSFDNNNSEAGKNYRFNRSAVGTHLGQTYRDGERSTEAFFQYDMVVDPTAPKNYLGVRYFGGDVGRTFDVYIDDVKFKSERVNNNAGNEFYIQYDEIPASALANIASKDRYKRDQAGNYVLDADGQKMPIITVRFQGNGTSYVGGVFGLYTTTTTTYSTDAELNALAFDGGTLSPKLADGTYDYTVTVPKEATTATFDVDPAMPSGLVYLGDVLIDDTQKRSVPLAAEGATTVTLRSVAQDHTTSKSYRLTVVRATAPALSAKVSVSTRCVSGKVTVVASVSNPANVPVALTLTSAFGKKSVASLAAGKSIAQTFTTRRAQIGAGAVTVTAIAQIDGQRAEVTKKATYTARSCG
ncbi:beta-L-arabinofuranosidase domain-containing protein [Microbacterium testaceum]|uniref:beta-L-arabinofuranosidase domain-containing protein n=1 Tax=Microbacterium testaceum TaxID=2033 RepID=UPI000AE3D502|nr:beta-L-arabinofuranosidase domain-containing protein [Microbacterium testaceum]